MRELSTGMAAAIAAPVTQPGYLIELLYSTPVRLCSRGDLTVLGNDWADYPFSLSGIDVDAVTPTQQGRISFGNADLMVSTLVLGPEGISDITINIWKFYGDAPDDADPLLIFSGVGGEATIDTANFKVDVSLRQAADRVQFAPNDYITVEAGFSLLPPAGKVLTFGKTEYTLQPEEL